MKKLLVTVLTVIVTMAPVQKTQAAAAAIMALSGVGAAGSVALAGLGSMGAGALGTAVAQGNSRCRVICLEYVLIGGFIGMILLDEEEGDISFVKIDPSRASELSLTSSEIQTFNSEIEEANIIFEDVVANLDEYSTLEQSKQLWNEVKEFVSADTFKVMKTIASQK